MTRASDVARFGKGESETAFVFRVSPFPRLVIVSDFGIRISCFPMRTGVLRLSGFRLPPSALPSTVIPQEVPMRRNSTPRQMPPHKDYFGRLHKDYFSANQEVA